MTCQNDDDVMAFPACQRDACGRCDEPIVASPHVIGLWLADWPAPRIGERGPRPGLCPDGEPHRPRKTDR